MTCFLNPLPSLDTVLRRSLKERETVYVSVVEAAGGRLAEFSANDPRRLANLFSRGLEFTQTARVVTPTAATERESEQEVPWHAAPSRDRSAPGPRPAICFFFCFPPSFLFSVFTPPSDPRSRVSLILQVNVFNQHVAVASSQSDSHAICILRKRATMSHAARRRPGIFYLAR